jgi:cyclopropane-fatty-acyl-phospholipid synthase
MEQASVAKLDRICHKLRLGPQDHVLEIGSGWGSFAIHAARKYGCRVTTTTLSVEQFELAGQRIRQSGLENRIEILRRDYRDLTGLFDKLVSIEMVEAVGHRYLPTYFGQCSRLLKPDGQMLLQAITLPDHRYEKCLRSVDFIKHYIFPGSCVPSLSAMTAALAQASDLRVVNVEDIGAHYATTLTKWRERFHRNLEKVRRLGYPERLIRLWTYYLSYCEAGFTEGYLGDLQILLSKPGCRIQPMLPPLNTAT